MPITVYAKCLNYTSLIPYARSWAIGILHPNQPINVCRLDFTPQMFILKTVLKKDLIIGPAIEVTKKVVENAPRTKVRG